MNAPELERRLADLLRSDAEAAMSTVNTEADLQALHDTVSRRRRTRRVLVAAALIAVVAASGSLAWPEPGADQAAPTESVLPRPSATAAGSRIAFGTYFAGHSELYVVNADGSGLRLLTRYSPMFEGSSGGTWSPDGRQIAFMTTTSNWLGLGQSEEVAVVDVDGGGVRVLTDDPASDQGHDWSPNGQQILFNRSSYNANDAAIYVMNADGSGQRRLVDGYSGIWSPNGKQIAISRDVNRDGHFTAWVMNADGSGLRRLTSSTTLGDRPVQWSPDGSGILVSHAIEVVDGGRAPGRGDLFVVAADGSREHRVASVVSPGLVAWSPDSQTITFTREIEGASSIYVVNADGSAERRLAEGAGPVWSPDSQKITFTREIEGVSSIYVVNADGSAERRLAEGAGPAWSPDGRQIAFGGDHSVWVINADGSGQRRLTPPMDQVVDPEIAWSPAIPVR